MKELIVPSCALGVVAVMLLPLPPSAIDFLIVGNLVLALVLFVNALLVPDPVRFSAFPTMLLLATLYRLSLNVGTTRLILNGGGKGSVIETFGLMATSGSIVVGLVLFLVITFVQFIVIAKGSERVAEVAARFTLDALPGKQMSIDADMRSGLLDFETARKRRAELQVESRFYGALDGAMKFIKGDAIAGLAITALNLVGGFVVGLAIQGLSFEHAIRTYSILTVGDGLLSQIPAFLNSLAAGIIVTRVARSPEESLAQDLLSQLGQSREGMLIVGAATLVLALLPGLPAAPFVIAGVLLCCRSRTRQAQPDEQEAGLRFAPGAVPPVEVVLPSVALEGEKRYEQLQKFAVAFQERAHERTGLILLPPAFRMVEADSIRISLRGALWKSYPHEDGNCLERLASELDELLERQVIELIDDQLTRRMLDTTESYAPELATGVVPELVGVTKLTRLLRELVREGVPVRSFDLVLQAVAEAAQSAETDAALLCAVRQSLARVIAAQFAADGVIRAMLLAPEADLLFGGIETTGELPSPPDIDTMADQLTRSRERIVLASRAARRILRDCLVAKGLEVHVLAHDEIPSDFRIDPAGILSIDRFGQPERLREAA